MARVEAETAYMEMDGRYYRIRLLPGNVPAVTEDDGSFGSGGEGSWTNPEIIYGRGMILEEDEARFFTAEGDGKTYPDMKRVTELCVQTEIMSLCFTFIEDEKGANSWRLRLEMSIWINGKIERFQSSRRWYGKTLVLNPCDGLVVLKDGEGEVVFRDIFVGSDPDSSVAAFHRGQEQM